MVVYIVLSQMVKISEMAAEVALCVELAPVFGSIWWAELALIVKSVPIFTAAMAFPITFTPLPNPPVTSKYSPETNTHKPG